MSCIILTQRPIKFTTEISQGIDIATVLDQQVLRAGNYVGLTEISFSAGKWVTLVSLCSQILFGGVTSNSAPSRSKHIWSPSPATSFVVVLIARSSFVGIFSKGSSWPFLRPRHIVMSGGGSYTPGGMCRRQLNGAGTYTYAHARNSQKDGHRRRSSTIYASAPCAAQPGVWGQSSPTFGTSGVQGVQGGGVRIK